MQVENNFYQNEEPNLINNQLEVKKSKNSSFNSKIQFSNVFNKMRLKSLIRRLASQTKSRMLQSLTISHYNLLNEQYNFQKINNNDLSRVNSMNSQLSFLKNIFDHICTFYCLAKCFPVFEPFCKAKLSWDVLMLCAISFLLFVIPIHICFDIEYEEFTYSRLVIFLSIFVQLDICVSLNTGFFKKGVFINKRSEILQNFIKTGFINDILGCGCLTLNYFDRDMFGSIDYKQAIFGYPLILFFFKLNHFSKLAKRFEERFILSPRLNNILQLFKLFSMILIISHVYSCLWIFIANLEQQQSVTSWLYIKGLSQDSTWYIKYCYSYYFISITMATVGYGDISPSTPLEQFFCIITVMTASGLFGYSINTIGMIFSELNKHEQEIRKKMYVINHFMQKKSISQNLQYEVREYLEYFYREIKTRDLEQEEKIVQQLPETLRQILMIEANKIILKDSPIFKKNFSEQVILRTIPLIQECRAKPEEIIIMEEDLNDTSIYFIEKGQVELFIQKVDKHANGSTQTLQLLQKGQFFGEYSFFTGQPQKFNVRSLDFTTLLKINRGDFITLLKNFQEDYEMFCHIKDSILLNNNYQAIESKCHSCQSRYHQINECPYIHHISNKTKILYKQNYSEQQQRKFQKRRRTSHSRSKLFQLLQQVEQYNNLNASFLDIYEEQYIPLKEWELEYNENESLIDYINQDQTLEDNIQYLGQNNNLKQTENKDSSQLNSSPRSSQMQNSDIQQPNQQCASEKLIVYEKKEEQQVSQGQLQDKSKATFLITQQNLEDLKKQDGITSTYSSLMNFKIQQVNQLTKQSVSLNRRKTKQPTDIKEELNNIKEQFININKIKEKEFNEFDAVKIFTKYKIWNNVNIVLEMMKFDKQRYKVILEKLKMESSYNNQCQQQQKGFNYLKKKEPRLMIQLNRLQHQLLDNNQSSSAQTPRVKKQSRSSNPQKKIINYTKNFDIKANDSNQFGQQPSKFNLNQPIHFNFNQQSSQKQSINQLDMGDESFIKEESVIFNIPITITGKFPYIMDGTVSEDIDKNQPHIQQDLSYISNNEQPLFNKQINASDANILQVKRLSFQAN